MKNPHTAIKVAANLVEMQGLEPRITEPKSAVLPLHHNSKKSPAYARVAYKSLTAVGRLLEK